MGMNLLYSNNLCVVGILWSFLCLGSQAHSRHLSAMGDSDSGNVIRVPTDYVLLNDAAANSSPGDTILVGPGVYDEVVLIWHPLTIIGSKASDVIVGGQTQNSGLYVDSSSVTIRQITSRNIITVGNSRALSLERCILNHGIGFTGSGCSVDSCVVLIDFDQPYGDPIPQSSWGAAVVVGTAGSITNCLVLRAHGRGAGHFEGTPPPFVTPRPGGSHGPWPGWAASLTGIGGFADSKMVNNTIVNVRGGDTGYLNYDNLINWAILYPGNGKGIGTTVGPGTVVANNIIWNIQGGEPKYPTAYGTWVEPGYSIGMTISCSTPTRNFTVEKNFIWDADYGITIDSRCGTEGYKIRDNYWVHPGFVNPASGDYHLLPNSPAIDAGTSIAWLLADADGNPRPTNFGWDIGAFEYQNLLSDLNHDGVVNALDLNEFVKQWGMELPKIKPSGKILIEPIDLAKTNPMPTPRLARQVYPTPNPELLPVTATPCNCPLVSTPTPTP